MNSTAVVFAFFLLSCLVTASARADGTGDPAPVEVGAVYNVTGPLAELGIPSLRGARLAVAEINRQGGVLGRRINLVVAEGDSTLETIRARTAELLEKAPSVVALMGLSDTDMVLAAAPLAAKSRRLFVTSGATSPRLPKQVPDYLFLACFGDNVQAAAAAEWAYESLSARSAVVLFNASMSYTRLLKDYFKSRFEQLGGHVSAVRSYRLDDLDGAIADLPQADMIFLSAGPEEAVRLSALLRKTGTTVPIVGGDGFDLEGAWRDHPTLAGIYFTTHAYLGADNPDPAIAAFRTAYLTAYPGDTPEAFAALGYDAARLVIAAIAATGSTDPATVRARFAGTKDFQGVTGSISYAAGSAIPRKSVSIIRIEGGRRHLVRQMVPAVIPPP